MSAAQDRLGTANERLPFWLGDLFCARLNHLEAQHQRIQSQHDAVRRGLESIPRASRYELLIAWQRYCAVIADLDRTTAELESLRSRPE